MLVVGSKKRLRFVSYLLPPPLVDRRPFRPSAALPSPQRQRGRGWQLRRRRFPPKPPPPLSPVSRSSLPAVCQRRAQTLEPAEGSRACGAEDEDDDWEGPPRRRQRQWRRHCRVMVLPTDANTDLAKLDGGIRWGCPNDGDHNRDVRDNAPVVFVAAGDCVEVVGGAVASGEFPPSPAFSLADPALSRARLGPGSSSNDSPTTSRPISPSFVVDCPPSLGFIRGYPSGV